MWLVRSNRTEPFPRIRAFSYESAHEESTLDAVKRWQDVGRKAKVADDERRRPSDG